MRAPLRLNPAAMMPKSIAHDASQIIAPASRATALLMAAALVLRPRRCCRAAGRRRRSLPSRRRDGNRVVSAQEPVAGRLCRRRSRQALANDDADLADSLRALAAKQAVRAAGAARRAGRRGRRGSRLRFAHGG